ncbi:Werner Syndrome-like exonuclease [Sitophilus oryzae]|uniref:3'-5' exonuclease n=1 Tax=Sitophilus oryzae TaxID=7048 RepID=A0A6J2Y9G5_SITOR|nr:Werner Syndrome-like exonuclease [Sitophilus oryzae]
MTERMRLRSSVPPEERELEIKRKKQEIEEKLNRPMIEYSGKINYTTTFLDCAFTCDDLLSIADNCSDDHMVVGFDMEWSFNFQTGPDRTALIQISPTLDVCHLLHISELRSLPKGLVKFLEHPKVRLTGVNIKNDVRKLSRDFIGFDAEKLVNNCIDSGVMANTVLPVTQRWSMEKLVDYVLKMKINKDKKVRMSRWHKVPLRTDQQVYAAIDGYASLLLYHELKKIESNLSPETIKQ